MSSNIDTMAKLFVEISRLLDGDDPTISDLSNATLARLVSVAEQRVYREVQSRWNEVPFTTLTTTNNLATLPADFESASIVHFGKQALIPTDENVLRDYWQGSGGETLYFARAGNALTFFPAAADGTAVQGRYWARLPPLSDATIASNPLFQNADDLFVYAALVESAPFFGARQDMPTWEAKYESIVAALNLHTSRAAYSAGRLQMRGVQQCKGRPAGGYYRG